MSGGSHPDLELLSDLYAGALPASETDELERHLEHCPSCLTRMDSLVETRDALRVIGADAPPMPADVTARLTNALREEAGTSEAFDDSGASAESTEPSSGGTDRGSRHLAPNRRSGRGGRSGRAGRDDRSGRAGRRRGRLARGLVVAASVAVLAVGGSVTYQVIQADSPGDPGRSTSASDENRDRSDGRSGDDQAYALADQPLRLTERDFDSQVRDAVVPRSEAEPKGSAPGTTDAPGSTRKQPGPRSSSPPPSSSPQEGTTRKDGEPMEDRGTGGMARSGRCVERALDRTDESAADQVLDIRPARLDGERAMLAITPGSSADTVHAWAIAGCPADGSVAYDAEIPVDR